MGYDQEFVRNKRQPTVVNAVIAIFAQTLLDVKGESGFDGEWKGKGERKSDILKVGR